MVLRLPLQGRFFLALHKVGGIMPSLIDHRYCVFPVPDTGYSMDTKCPFALRGEGEASRTFRKRTDYAYFETPQAFMQTLSVATHRNAHRSVNLSNSTYHHQDSHLSTAPLAHICTFGLIEGSSDGRRRYCLTRTFWVRLEEKASAFYQLFHG